MRRFGFAEPTPYAKNIPIMTDAPAITRANPILAKFRAALAEMYGDRLERVMLYGSQARGDAQPDSDYDVAIFWCFL